MWGSERGKTKKSISGLYEFSKLENLKQRTGKVFLRINPLIVTAWVQHSTAQTKHSIMTQNASVSGGILTSTQIILEVIDN